MTSEPLDPLDRLAAASTAVELLAAHRAVARSVLKRRQQVKAHGILAQTIDAAQDIWLAQQAQGVSLADRLRDMEKTLRASWPYDREWKILCQRCDDTGLVMGQCVGDRTCPMQHCNQPHTYGVPCWCSLGARFKPKPHDPNDFKSAGKQKRFSRLGH